MSVVNWKNYGECDSCGANTLHSYCWEGADAQRALPEGVEPLSEEELEEIFTDINCHEELNLFLKNVMSETIKRQLELRDK
jgi:hypothetical protein